MHQSSGAFFPALTTTPSSYRSNGSVTLKWETDMVQRWTNLQCNIWTQCKWISIYEILRRLGSCDFRSNQIQIRYLARSRYGPR